MLLSLTGVVGPPGGFAHRCGPVRRLGMRIGHICYRLYIQTVWDNRAGADQSESTEFRPAMRLGGAGSGHS